MRRNYLIFIILALFISNISCNYIQAQFKTNVDLNSINEDNFMKTAMESKIYINFKIGESNQEIPMTLKTMKYPTFIVSSNITDEDIKIKYDETKSPNSFKYLINDEIKNVFIYDFTQGYYVSDFLNFNSSYTFKNFNFILATKMNGISKNISGEIGFSTKKETQKNYIYPQKTNFIQQLFENNIISQKIFGIKYDTEYEGRLILGTNLYDIDHSYSKEDAIINDIDNDVPDLNKENWLIKINLNFTKNDNQSYREKSYSFLMYEIGLIFGSHNYRKNFIIDYFKNRQCQEKEITSTPYSFYQYSCDNESQFEDFPNLAFGIEGKYSFNFTKNDLFKKVGNKYFFLIVFQVTLMDINYWRFGQLFFRKYPIFLIQNANHTQFIYYQNNEEHKEDDKSDDKSDNETGDNKGSNNTALIVSLSIIIPLIIIGVILFLLFHFKKRKKLLDDELLKEEANQDSDCKNESKEDSAIFKNEENENI